MSYFKLTHTIRRRIIDNEVLVKGEKKFIGLDDRENSGHESTLQKSRDSRVRHEFREKKNNLSKYSIQYHPYITNRS